ncbi:MAG TPA: hypothetical protein VGN72_10245 [Tepidisphaeraceae bacterium]|jgi:hypothetical protein|nr:hypothetical protein [Tepidisphaeraceae bacterium]
MAEFAVNPTAYDRLAIGFHGTRRKTVESLLRGRVFDPSENTDDWLGHGIYFWEHAPQQAWWWAERRYGKEAAVVGAVLRLGQCIDLLDPKNAELLELQYQKVAADFKASGLRLPQNANNHKYLDCLVFNQLFVDLASAGFDVETVRAVFVPTGPRQRVWSRSGIFHGAHIQLCVRESKNIIGVWSVRKDGTYGKE